MRTNDRCAIHTPAISPLVAAVVKELRELRRVGGRVPDRAFILAEDTKMVEDFLVSMSVSETADLLIELSHC